jgi:amino acid adenylation domain-containing protein
MSSTNQMQEVFILPASFAQQRMWFIDQLQPGQAAYNLPVGIRIQGKFDVALLEKVLQEIVHRHEPLRTSIMVVEGEPQQIIASEATIRLPIVDLNSFPHEQRESEARRLLQEEVQTPFNLQQAPLLRAKCLQLGQDDCLLIFTMHHIISDAWSLGVLVREVSVLYEAFSTGRASPLPALAIQYADFTQWQRERTKGDLLERQLQYWRRQLAGTSILELPTARSRPAVMNTWGATYRLEFYPQLSDGLKELARGKGATLYMVLLAAFQVLLHRYSGQQDIAVGSPIAGRTRPELENLIGFFVNTLVLRTDFAGEPRFTDLLRAVKATTIDAYAHQDVPFEMVVDALQPERDLSRWPLFQVDFTFQNVPARELHLGTAKLQLIEVDNGTAKLDLSLFLAERGGSLYGGLIYNTDLFDEPMIASMFRRFEILLHSIVGDPEQPVAALSLLSEQEQRTITAEWNGPSANERGENLCDLVAAHARESARAIALISDGAKITFRELNRRANQLAHRLRTLGVRTESRVAVCLERPVELVAAALAILKCGGVFVPIDPGESPSHGASVAADSGALLVLTGEGLQQRFPNEARPVLCLDKMEEELAQESSEEVSSGLTDDRIACVLYRPGPTGLPVGILVQMRGLQLSPINGLEIVATDRVAQTLNFGLETTCFEIFRVLAAGACFIDVPRHRWAPDSLAKFLENTTTTVLLGSAWVLEGIYRKHRHVVEKLRMVVCEDNPASLQALRSVVDEDLRGRILAVYGYPEAGGCRFAYPLAAVQEPIENATAELSGHLAAGAKFYLLDDTLTPVPEGVTGSIYLAGASLALGYDGQPEQTAYSFIPDPFAQVSGARMLNTGDNARWRRKPRSTSNEVVVHEIPQPPGRLEFAGRVDLQINIRGFRVQLAAVERLLVSHSRLSQAVVQTHRTPAGTELIAYVVPLLDPGTTADELWSELQSHAAKLLPEYSQPSAFVILEALPLTNTGLPDRCRLTKPEPPKESYRAPQTPQEKMLSEIFAEVLSVERVGIDSNFFSLGGNSLKATRLFSRVRAAWNFELKLRMLYESPTVAGLAAHLSALAEGRHREAKNEMQPIVRVPRDQDLPLSYAQQRLWFIHQLDPGDAAYNVAAAVRVQGFLNIDVLEKVLREIVRRHESLRTRFVAAPTGPRQVVEAEAGMSLQMLSLASLPEERRETEAKKLAMEEANVPFNLEIGPLLRLKLLRLSDEDYVLLLTMHHIVSDGWSMEVLLREVSILYEAFSSGHISPLPELLIQYADYSGWQRTWLGGPILEEQLAYWKKQLDGVSPLMLPTDRPSPARASHRGSAIAFQLDSPGEKLRELAQRQDATLFMVLLAAFKVLLCRYTGQYDIAVGSPVSGRRLIETENLIGFFVNTLVLRTDLSSIPTFIELLRLVKDTTIEAQAYQDIPFEKLVEALQPERELSRTPLFQVVMVLESALQSSLRLGTATLVPFTIAGNTSKFDLTILFSEGGTGIRGTLEYCTDLFDAQTIRRMIGHFQVLLEGIVSKPDRSVLDLPILTPDEHQQLLVLPNDGDGGEVKECIHALFEAQAERTPKAVAVVYQGSALSYGELNRRANRLAHFLRKMGVRPDERVAICAERGLDMVIALVAVLKAGGAYVFLDPAYPLERLQYMLKDCAPVALLAQGELKARFEGGEITQLFDLADAAGITKDEPDTNLKCAYIGLTPEHLACVIYTSGSTGKPKGSEIPHRSIPGFIFGTDYAHFDEQAVLLQHSSVSWDILILELWPALMKGGRCVLAHQRVLSADDIRRYVQHAGVNILWLTAAMFSSIVESDVECLQGIRDLLTGGETVPASSLKQALARLPGTRLVNAYGPSECTVFSTCYVAPRILPEELGSVPIGRPIGDRRVYVLDALLNPVPTGVVGEIYVGGPAVGRGYLRRAKLTAERFLPDPFSSATGLRMYRTGDLARWTVHGELEFIGRADFQVKIRGFRIEPGEVEARIAECPGVQETAVIVREDVPGEKRLVAYYTTIPKEGTEAEELRTFLASRVPAYMVPSAFVRMESMPLTSNGKLDRKALPQPVEAARVSANQAPQGEMEAVLAEIWRDMLHREHVGREDNFFELGGHSLLLVRVVARVRQILGVETTISDLFTHPRLKDFAHTLESASLARGKSPTIGGSGTAAEPQWEQPAAPVLVSIQPHGPRSPFFCVHPIGGQVHCYAALASSLGKEQPFYGLQSPQWDAFGNRFPKIEQMAALYIKEIRRVQPHGPYSIGGWSMGGLVAWEMAAQLREQKESLGVLALFDCHPFTQNRQLAGDDGNLPMVARFALDMARWLGRDPDHFRGQFPEADPQEQWRMVQEELVREGVFAPSRAREEMSHLLDVFTANVAAMEQYALRAAPQRVVLFAASAGGQPEQLASQWKTYAEHGVELHLVSGNHYTMLRPPDVEIIAGLLKHRL